MTTETPARLLTAEEFWHYPNPAHGGKVELVCGKVVEHMPVGRLHSVIALNIGAEIRAFVRQHKLGQAGMELGFTLARDPDIVRAPDAHFIRKDRLGDDPFEPGFFVGHPDLAVEVTSPDDTDTEVHKKLQEYLAAGTPRVWIVRPEMRTVTVYHADGTARTLADDDAELTSDDAGFEADGFLLRIADVFE